jgi:hypothetical protein
MSKSKSKSNDSECAQPPQLSTNVNSIIDENFLLVVGDNIHPEPKSTKPHLE